MFDMLLKVYCVQLSLSDISLSILAQEKAFLAIVFAAAAQTAHVNESATKKYSLFLCFRERQDLAAAKQGKGSKACCRTKMYILRAGHRRTVKIL